MRLINPTDDELNAAFAEKVAGWKCEMIDGAWSGDVGVPAPVWTSPEGNVSTAYYIPPFTRSMDAVLPFAEKLGWKGTSNRAGSTCLATVSVVIPGAENPPFEMMATQDWRHTQTPLPRACVVALLRANGVEVEITK